MLLIKKTPGISFVLSCSNNFLFALGVGATCILQLSKFVTDFSNLVPFGLLAVGRGAPGSELFAVYKETLQNLH